jgi:hypothetical protein
MWGDEVQDLERVRYVTARYEQLQGLRRVPLRLILLVVGGGEWTVRALIPAGGIDDRYGKLVVPEMVDAFFYLLAVVALVLYYVIGEHYERRFGRVERRPVGWRRTTAMIAAFLVIWATVVSVELWLEPPLRLGLLVMGGAVLLFFQRKLRRFAAHYLVMGGDSGLWPPATLRCLACGSGGRV